MPLSELNGMKKIGLIAGNGKFPLMFAIAARRRGLDVVAVAIKKDTSLLITPLVKKVYWLSLQEFSKMFDVFREENITQVIMAGQVNPQKLFYKNVGDETLRRLLASIKDKRPDTVFGAVADMLAKHNIKLIDSTLFLEEYLPKQGILTKCVPDEATWKDVNFGFDMAKKIAGLDIGQTLVVKNGSIIAVEAIEGTDEAILRGGRLVNGGIIVIKVSKPYQDMRFDIPVVGPRTIKYLSRMKAVCLAIEAQKTLMIDPEICIREAEKRKISIVAL